jgi:hypothetical protein
MAPAQSQRPHALCISALALATLSLASTVIPSQAQTVYRDFDDRGFDAYVGEEDVYEAPLRRRPSVEDDDDDERFEKDDPDDDNDDYDSEFPDDRQGNFDLSPPRNPQSRAPLPPPSVNAKPHEKAWKPAL